MSFQYKKKKQYFSYLELIFTNHSTYLPFSVSLSHFMSSIYDLIKMLHNQVSTANKIISYFHGNKADLVVCDGAPDG